MKKAGCFHIAWFAILLFCVATCSIAFASEAAWDTQPIVTAVYEQETGKLYLEWDGQAASYQLFLDGKQIQRVAVNSALIDVSRGTHSIKIVPLHSTDGSDVNVQVNGPASFSIKTGFNTGAVESGIHSATVNIDYLPDSILSAAPVEPTITMDADNHVLLSFIDPYNADE